MQLEPCTQPSEEMHSAPKKKKKKKDENAIALEQKQMLDKFNKTLL